MKYIHQGREIPQGRRVTPDLSRRPASKLEWWFVQGFLEGKVLGRREIMVSFFRQSGEHESYMLLAASYDAGKRRHSVRSEITREAVENFNREASEFVHNTTLDRALLKSVLEEIAEGGPARPVVLAEEAVTLSDSPLSISWRDFSLRQQGETINIACELPGDGLPCELSAEPFAAWFEGRDISGIGPGNMSYDCCPRLRLSGTAGGEDVAGSAWFDHQWGGYSWMRAPGDDSTLLGWDWVGINLDDGRDLLVTVQRDMRTREPVSCFGVLMDGMRTPEILDRVTINAVREWRSPASMIDYPVGCAIEIPSLDACLEFAPLVDDQEIPVFGLIDAIWEGAGRVAGKIAGEPVSGRARLELHGYGYVFDFKAYQKKWIERIDRNISAFLPRELDQSRLAGYVGTPRWSYDAAAQTEMLSKPVWDLLSRGGKHWRPIFGYLLLDALGADVTSYETMLSTLPELIHNGSVIVDDIEDSSLTRRGEETIHRRYGLPTALNAGNTLYFLPLLSIAENPHLSPGQRDALYQVAIAMFVQAHLGQAQDLYWSKLRDEDRLKVLNDEKTSEVILQAHACKSAAAVRATAEFACVIAGSGPQIRAACLRFAESWGVAFQIVDDVNNFQVSPRWGKVCGEDVSEGKISYVIHKAVCMLEGSRRKRLLDILISEKRRRNRSGLEEAIALIESSGALEECRREARELAVADWPAFSRSIENSRAKFMLRALLETLLETPFEM